MFVAGLVPNPVVKASIIYAAEDMMYQKIIIIFQMTAKILQIYCWGILIWPTLYTCSSRH